MFDEKSAKRRNNIFKFVEKIRKANSVNDGFVKEYVRGQSKTRCQQKNIFLVSVVIVFDFYTFFMRKQRLSAPANVIIGVYIYIDIVAITFTLKSLFAKL